MLKLWWEAPEGDLLILAWQVRPPHFPHSQLHRSGFFSYIGSALWNIGRILRPAPLGLRYHRALYLGRRDDQIRRICQAFNVKEPTRFMVKSWIVGSDQGHDSAIRSVFLFCYQTSTSASLCQDEKYKKKTFQFFFFKLHDKIYLPSINQWYMLYLKSLDH